MTGLAVPKPKARIAGTNDLTANIIRPVHHLTGRPYREKNPYQKGTQP